MILARILWLQGFPDQGLRLSHENIEDAKEVGHALSVCGDLEVACLVAIWSGELVAAERSVAMPLDHSARHGLAAWHARGRCLNGVLLIRRGEGRTGSRCSAPRSTSCARPALCRTRPVCSARWRRAWPESDRSPRPSR